MRLGCDWSGRNMTDYSEIFRGIDPKQPQAVLGRAIDHFGDRITMATSFQVGGLVLLDMVHRLGKTIRVFSIDTGRLPEETFECAETIRRQYGIQVEWVFPRHAAVQDLVDVPTTGRFQPGKRGPRASRTGLLLAPGETRQFQWWNEDSESAEQRVGLARAPGRRTTPIQVDPPRLTTALEGDRMHLSARHPIARGP